MQLLAILFFLAVPTAPQQPAGCWADVGVKDLYSSIQQIQDLQRVAKSGECEILAISWRVRLRPDRHSLMLWDSRQELVVRIHVEGSAITWESWRGVDRSHILTDDPSREFDYASHRDGEGQTPLSGNARSFIAENAGDAFAPALQPDATRDSRTVSSGF